jgi:two-component system, HptB-dependent secretion and biofilm response regulator
VIILNERRLKILIVDDVALNRQILSAQLQHLGHQAFEAEDGHDALERFLELGPDIVLMDLAMPLMDGIEAARLIRTLPNARWVPIIMLTGHRDEAEFISALSAGCDDYLSKPIKLSILEAKINALQRIAEMQQEIENQRRELQNFYALAEEEMSLTQHIMTRLVHRELVDIPPITTWSEAAKGASGDVIVAVNAESGLRYAMLADATGHGLAAAVTLIPVTNVFYAMTAKGFNAGSIVEEMNRQVRSYCPVERFVALALVAVNPQSNVIEVWNGGIPPLLALDASGREVRRFKSRHLPLGIVGENMFRSETEFLQYDTPLQLAIFSDGLIEAGAEEQFGMERVLTILTTTPPAERMSVLQQALRDFLGAQRPHDDVSLALFDCPTSMALRGVAATPHELLPSSGVQCDWQLQTTLSAAQLKEIDFVPMVVNWAQAMGLSKVSAGTFFLVVTELFMNALEHGVLGLSSSLKNEVDGFERYVEARQRSLQNLQKGQIVFALSYRNEQGQGVIRIQVQDSGAGFNYRALGDDGLIASRRLSGRGIALLRRFCRSVEYHGAGNKVSAELVC